jgi:membrane protease YdiL (CAAX protease family)
LIDQDFRPVPGWAVLLFLAALPVIGLGVLYLLPDRSMMSLLGLFFLVGLASVVVATLPMGGAAFPALAIRPVGWRPVVLGVLGTLAVSIAVSQYGPEAEGLKDAMKVVREPRSFLLSLGVLALLAPLAEELVFRGLLYGWLEGRWGPRVALVASSIAFAAAHIEPAHILLVLPLGFLFGWLRSRTGSLVPSVVAHMANNATAVLAAAFVESG